MSNEAIKYIEENIDEIVKTASRTHLLNYSKYVDPALEIEHFHRMYYEVLDLFAQGKIKKLMITMPPQHGKSEGSSRKLPSFILGQDPNRRVAIGSYSRTFAQGFNRDVQKQIESPEYRELFPDTTLNGMGKKSFRNVYVRNSNLAEIVGYKGSIRVVGWGNGLTGNPVDMMIMDDLYKDSVDGNSPTIREKIWKWYINVVRARLHNKSQELIVFTRWNKDDLIGRLEDVETVITINSLDEIKDVPEDAWVKINFEAIKESEPTAIDPRERNQPLWNNRHSLKSLQGKRKLDEHEFDCLYQGAPGSASGMLYKPFKTYRDVSDYGVLIGKNNYTDTADTGDDFLLSISYDVVNGKDELGGHIKYLMIQDMVYTDEPVEVTMESVPMLLKRANTRLCRIESNAGGRTFAVTVQKSIRKIKANCEIGWFHQSGNKESRIVTNAGLVNQHIIMPHDWKTRFSAFYKDVSNYKRMFAANKHDDTADVLTGMIEKEILEGDFVVL